MCALFYPLQRLQDTKYNVYALNNGASVLWKQPGEALLGSGRRDVRREASRKGRGKRAIVWKWDMYEHDGERAMDGFNYWWHIDLHATDYCVHCRNFTHRDAKTYINTNTHTHTHTRTRTRIDMLYTYTHARSLTPTHTHTSSYIHTRC